jgi:hypothetical protein
VSEYYHDCALPKPEPRQRVKGRIKRSKIREAHEVRMYVFARERGLCRICRCRRSESMHELRFRSLGVKIHIRNSVCVCGSGTTGCHGLAQTLQVKYIMGPEGAEGTITFTACTKAAADHLKIAVGEAIESPVMATVEAEE